MADLRRSEGFVSPSRTRVLLALIRVHQRDGRATVRQVAGETGLSYGTTFHHLTRLVEAGLVGRTEKQCGTLRPLVKVVDRG